MLVISWPAPSTGFELNQSADPALTNWTTPSETVSDNGTSKFITVSPMAGGRYCRLVKP